MNVLVDPIVGRETYSIALDHSAKPPLNNHTTKEMTSQWVVTMALRVPRPSRIARTTRESPSTKRARKSISPAWSRDVIRDKLGVLPTCCHNASTASSSDTTGPMMSGAPSI